MEILHNFGILVLDTWENNLLNADQLIIKNLNFIIYNIDGVL